MHFFGSRRDIHIHSEIETARALEFIPDQEGNFARSKPVDQNLCWSDGDGVRHAGIGNGDALQSFGRVNEQRLTYHHTQRRRSRSNAPGRRIRGRWLLGSRVRSRRSRSVLWLSVGGPDAREHRGRTQNQNGCDECKCLHEFGPLRGCTSKSTGGDKCTRTIAALAVQTWSHLFCRHDSFLPDTALEE